MSLPFPTGFLLAPAVQEILEPLAANEVDHHRNWQDGTTSNRCVEELRVINGQGRKVLSEKACQEGERQKDGAQNRQPLHDFIGTL